MSKKKHHSIISTNKVIIAMCESLSIKLCFHQGINETAIKIVQTASYEHEQKGISGAVGSVIRQIPPAIVNPIIIGAQATNHVIDGVRGHLMPDARREASQKWRSDDG